MCLKGLEEKNNWQITTVMKRCGLDWTGEKRRRSLNQAIPKDRKNITDGERESKNLGERGEERTEKEAQIC